MVNLIPGNVSRWLCSGYRSNVGIYFNLGFGFDRKEFIPINNASFRERDCRFLGRGGLLSTFPLTNIHLITRTMNVVVNVDGIQWEGEGGRA